MRKRMIREKKMRKAIYFGGTLFLETLYVKRTRQHDFLVLIKLGHLLKGFLNITRLIINRLDLILATAIEESI